MHNGKVAYERRVFRFQVLGLGRVIASRSRLTLERFESPSPRASDSAFLLGGAASAIVVGSEDVKLLTRSIELH